MPFALLNLAAFRTGTYNFEIIFGCLFILWASDTGAYFAGTYLGKTKLFERISPKKSWEGFFGGALLALVFALGIAHYFQSLSTVQWLVVWGIIMVGGTFGDLVESLLKRSIAIKDSGSSIPGHGGFLDRFDGLFLAAPFHSSIPQAFLTGTSFFSLHNRRSFRALAQAFCFCIRIDFILDRAIINPCLYKNIFDVASLRLIFDDVHYRYKPHARHRNIRLINE